MNNGSKVEKARLKYFQSPFDDNFYFRFPKKQEFEDIYQKEFLDEFLPSQFVPQMNLNSQEVISDYLESQKKVDQQNLYDRILLVNAQEEPVAAFEGYQQKYDQYYMKSSVVKKGYRKKGIYREFFTRLQQYTRELNLMHLTSLHHAYNNPILIAKLKLGFHISGYTIDISWGNMIMLSYFNNPEYEKLFKYRVGHRTFSDNFVGACRPKVQDFFRSLGKEAGKSEDHGNI